MGNQQSQPPDLVRILQEVVENANEGFVTIDQESTVLFFNRAAERMFGYDRREVLGRNLALILSSDCARDHGRAVCRYARTRIASRLGHEREMIVTRKNGETFPASISFSVLEKDQRFFFTGIVRDLSDEKNLKQQLLQAERLAALGQAVAEITHEIKNPLVLIGGLARQLQRVSLPGRERDKLESIVFEVGRLERLLHGLRDLYRPWSLQLGAVDLQQLLTEVRSLVQAEAEAQGVCLRLEAGPGPAVVTADRERLKQVLINLVGNSLEALAKDGGEIGLRLELSPRSAAITVSDTGPGIPASVQERLFSPFVTTKKEGTGLGLCIARRIVEAHPGGSLGLHSEQGRGTVATIQLARKQG